MKFTTVSDFSGLDKLYLLSQMEKKIADGTATFDTDAVADILRIWKIQQRILHLLQMLIGKVRITSSCNGCNNGRPDWKY